MMNYKEVAKKYGIEQIGVCDASLYNKYVSENSENNNEKYSTALVALFPYYVNQTNSSNLSKYCQSLDYHKICTKILDNICNDCNFLGYKIACDIGFPIDRELAKNAGLGFYGLNSMLINDEFGSYFFIAYALLKENLPLSKPLLKTCMMCKKCINNCPNNAIKDDFKIDEEKCVSFITQKKGDLTNDEISLVKSGGLIFGCDKCSDVCPHNKNVKNTIINEFYEDRIENLFLSDICNLSNKEFKKNYGKYAFAWRGKAVLERNLKILEETLKSSKAQKLKSSKAKKLKS